MQRQTETFTLAPGEYEHIKQRMLNWAQPFSILCFLDSNDYQLAHSRYECLLAVDPIDAITPGETDPLQSINHWHQEHKDWLFGHITYDYKNKLEPKLSSSHDKAIGWDDVYFFCPRVVCTISKDKTTLTIGSIGIAPAQVRDEIFNTSITVAGQLPLINFTPRVKQEQYLQTINDLRRHIADGDCYEINYCVEGYVEDVTLDTFTVFNALNKISPAPYAAYYRNDDKHMMCASPERYIMKQGRKVLSQPIKGTARRDTDTTTDNQIREALYNSIKDRAENVMIVDLVRNDIARSSKIGSVQVDELFGIYSFPQVHQMISTVSGELCDDLPFTDAIRYSFPMGSMTGAPKIKVMQLIEQYEQSRRELFSGTVGYIDPNGDFDFNVIIRSLYYNASAHYLSYQTGGAITYDSTPQQEYEEMRLKAWALERVFKGAQHNV